MNPDRNHAENANVERSKWATAFEYCMQQLSGMYNREFNHPTAKAYMDGCAGWSIKKMREAFRLAMATEKFCPTIATIRNYAASVREERVDVGPTCKPPIHTPEEAEDIKSMIADLRAKGLSMPLAKPLPGGFEF